MKQTSILAQQVVDNMRKPSATHSTRSLPLKWVAALFGRLEAIYLQKWADQFRTQEMLKASMEEWGKGLSDLQDAQIGRAIEVCRNEHKWPPSIAEFRQAALNNEPGIVRNHEAHNDITGISRQIESDEVKAKRKVAAVKGLKEIRSILR